MHIARTTALSSAVLGLALIAFFSSASHAASADGLSERHRQELVAFSAMALGIKVSLSEIKKNTPTADLYELVATGINLNGHLCARVTSITPLKVAGGYEVVCIANRGGAASKAYNVDANLGKAHPL